MRQRDRQRGSVLLMVIGLLTVIAMLGSMLLLVARLDRQTSQAIAAAAPEDQVAQGLLDRILADRLADLYIDEGVPANPNDDILYGKLEDLSAPLADRPLIAERRMIDYPHEDYDAALACTETYDPGSGAVWRHVSHLPGTTLVRDLQPNALLRAIDVPTNDPNLVDADGDTTVNDALLFATGIFDSNGNEFYAAVRMIDASGLLNVNIAGTPANAGGGPRVADITRVMDPSYLALEGVLGLPSATAVVNDREPAPTGTGNGPYDMGDMLAVGWQGDPVTQEPNAANGRLCVAAASDFLAARASLTGESTSTPLSPLCAYMVAIGIIPSPADLNKVKVSLDDPDANPVNDLNARKACYNAFLAMLQAYDYDATPGVTPNRTKAAQLTVNLMDYLDQKLPGDDEDYPTQLDAHDLDANFPSAGTDMFYGIERHPYVSKVFRKLVFNPAPPPILIETAAIELINPYAHQIDLTNYHVKWGPNDAPLTGKYITPAGTPPAGRFVIYTDSSILLDPGLELDPDSQQVLAGLTTGAPVLITWKHPDPAQGWEIRIDETEGITLTEPTASDPEARWNAKFRDDDLSHGRYTLPNYVQSIVPGDQDPAVNYTDAAGPKMGQVNPPAFVTAIPGGDPVPVYVRNEQMICLGDMMRLFVVGPKETQSLSAALGATPTGRQLLPSGNVLPATLAKVPLGCMASEFFNLLTPQDDAAGNPLLHRGLVNINTAPASVLKCLPGITALGAPAQNMVDEIIAYRDRGKVGSSNDYTPDRGAAGITNLRNQHGFATASEVAIPLRKALDALGLKINTYDLTAPLNEPPQNYRFGPAPDDDGLPIDTTTRMNVLDDPIKEHVLYTWLSNQVTVRSNTFLIYIRVQRDNKPGSPNRRYVAVVDRGNCRAVTDRPRVLMFAELR